ncbi:MAG: PEP-CTERM sorting domain-containing protein [Candidatus Omnitrophica bacterium]|nr:PEP-CTERM sorting domain-containing protein [Candidatus Omnitrophota bacterium]MDD5737168.1 PEP-CTERM sorting domain-containing protein [Candidatus Omnitrophota bacterium]
MSAIFCLFPIPQAQALDISGYDADLYDRFVAGTYGTDNPVANPDFIGASYDWSGVGWQTDYAGRSVAMVSAQNFVCANHYRVPVGSTVSFVNSLGQLKTYTVQGYSTFDYQLTQNGNPLYDNNGNPYMCIPDLALGWLTEAIPVSDGVTSYSVLDADDYSTSWFDTGWYTGKDLLVYGWTARTGNNTIDGFTNVATTGFSNPTNGTTTAVYSYDRNNDPQGQAGAQGGDSGSPSFMVWNGQITIAGTHFAVSTGSTEAWNTYDSFVPYYADDIDSAMSSAGYSLNRIKIDVFPDKLKNAGFESFSWDTMGPSDWDFRNDTGDGSFFDMSGVDNEHKRSGSRSASIGEMISDEGQFRHDASYSQTIAGSTDGQTYGFSFWYQNLVNVPAELLASSAEVMIAAGIDPTGGSDPDSSNIIWNMVTLTPEQFDAAWHQIMVAAQSNGTPMTFFIKRYLSGSISSADIAAGKYWSVSMCIDDANISIVPEPATLLLLMSGLAGFRFFFPRRPPA